MEKVTAEEAKKMEDRAATVIVCILGPTLIFLCMTFWSLCFLAGIIFGS